MPELPEVETVRRQLEKEVVGRRVLGVAVRFAGRLNVPASTLARRVRGATVVAARRRAKVLLLDLSNGWTLVSHLKMTGKWLLAPGGSASDRHAHLTFRLDDGRELLFHDVRKFGYVRLHRTDEVPGLLEGAGGYGPEPLDRAFTAVALAARLHGRGGRRKIKPLLMDQSFVAGVGNIYADESLWRARVRPDRAASTLGAREIAALHAGIVGSMRESLRRGGTSADNYADLYGRQGRNVPHLDAYGRGGEPCRRCGMRLVKVTLAGRGTVFCEHCQK